MNNQTNLFGGLKKPKTQLQAVLYHLIMYGKCSLEDYPKWAGLRTRFSNIRVQLSIPLDSMRGIGINQFGRTIWYNIHILKPENREKAIEVYKRIRG